MSKGTRLKVYAVKAEMIDFIVGRNPEEALEHYTTWLNEHMAQWKILSEPEYKGEAW